MMRVKLVIINKTAGKKLSAVKNSRFECSASSLPASRGRRAGDDGEGAVALCERAL